MINYLKVGAIWLTDTVNKLYDPFEKATYSHVQSLNELEEDFFRDIRSRFVKDGHFAYELPLPADRGDCALFQGLYTAMINLKFPHDCTEVREANAALGNYFVNSTLIRGVREDGTFNDTTSNDSATGALFGLYCIWRRGTWEADHTIQRWADRIIDANYALTNLEGEPTKYGQLVDGWRTDPLRLVILLSILKLAAVTCSGESVYQKHYDKLYRMYRPLLRYPKVRLLWLDTDYDTHRAAIHLHVLWSLTADTVYADGLKRLSRITAKENNAWVQLLCQPFGDGDYSILNTFHSPRRLLGNIESINNVESVKWGKRERAKAVLPIDHRGSQEFFWQRNMFSKDEWVGNTSAGAYHSGLDFLLAYWLGIRLGLLK